MDNKESIGFNYTYSAKEQAEIKKIREKYTNTKGASEKSDIEKLRALDKSVTKTAAAFAISLGVISALIMGFGMSLIMTELKIAMGIGIKAAYSIGITTGIVGMIGVIIAYPVYQKITERERKRIAPEIIRLTEDLIDD